MQSQSLLQAHGIITPLDLIITAIALVAAAVALARDRHAKTLGRTMPPWSKYLLIWMQYFLGVHALVSGPNYFLHFYPQMQMAHPLAGPFQHYMESVGLFGVVKFVETVVGLCLVFDIFVPAALIFEMPISFSIFYLSVFVVADPRTLWTGPRELIFNLVLLAAYGGWLLPILKPRIRRWPLWTLARPDEAG
jgi:hypothetical protein